MSSLLRIPCQTALVKIGPVNVRRSDLQNLQRERNGRRGERTPRDGNITVARGEGERERRPRERGVLLERGRREREIGRRRERENGRMGEREERISGEDERIVRERA